jgi:hypothetical protein
MPDLYVEHLTRVINDPAIVTSRLSTNITKTYTPEFYQSLKQDKNIPLVQKRQALEKAMDLLGRGRPVRRTKAINMMFMQSTVRNSLNDVAQNSVIPILKKVDDKDLHEILKFNNFEFEIPKDVKYNKREPVYDWLTRNEKYKPAIPAVNATPIDEKEEDMERKSVEYSKYYNDNHGYIGALFLQSFDVNLPSDELDAFMKANPNPTIMPAFHGTGSIAASMILRFGFAVVKKAVGGVAVTGKMLGDGVYFSNVLTKALQYTGDSGFSRNEGTIGYILEMEAFIGKEGVNYKSAGTSGNDGIRSPEWCVFDPRSQLRIYKAHKVKIVNRDVIDKLKAKYPDAVNEDRYFKRFKTFLKEQEMPTTFTNTFIFYDGRIPLPDGTLLPFDQFQDRVADNPNIHVNYSQCGPEVTTVSNFDVDGLFFHIPDSSELVLDNPEGIFDKWTQLLNSLLPPAPQDNHSDGNE